VELWSCAFEVASCQLIAVFSMVREPPSLVKSEVVVQNILSNNEYNVLMRPSKVLTSEDQENREERRHRKRLCLQLDCFQRGADLKEQECVFHQCISQAELRNMLPVRQRAEFVAFENMDLSCGYIINNHKEWMPLICNRVRLKEEFRGSGGEAGAGKIDRDASMLWKLKLERTIFRR